MADPKVVVLHGGPGAKSSASRDADALAAGAARASGERAKRRRTPLLMDPSADEISLRPALSDLDALSPVSTHRPRPVPRSGGVLSAKAGRTARTRSQKESARSGRSALVTALDGASTAVTKSPSGRIRAKRATPRNDTVSLH